MTFQAMTVMLLWIAAIASGLVAGLFLAFSTFIMRALSRIPPMHGMTAMQSINSTILGSAFLPLFFGSTLVCVVLVALAAARWSDAGSGPMLAGAAVYVVGMFLCTVIRNVPLNNELARLDVGSRHAQSLWPRYLRDWTFWNHVRTAASTVAFGLFIVALIETNGEGSHVSVCLAC